MISGNFRIIAGQAGKREQKAANHHYFEANDLYCSKSVS